VGPGPVRKIVPVEFLIPLAEGFQVGDAHLIEDELIDYLNLSLEVRYSGAEELCFVVADRMRWLTADGRDVGEADVVQGHVTGSVGGLPFPTGSCLGPGDRGVLTVGRQTKRGDVASVSKVQFGFLGGMKAKLAPVRLVPVGYSLGFCQGSTGLRVLARNTGSAPLRLTQFHSAASVIPFDPSGQPLTPLLLDAAASNDVEPGQLVAFYTSLRLLTSVAWIHAYVTDFGTVP
jgi:hypothetical protein